MIFLYPSSELTSLLPDEMYRDELQAMSSTGFETYIFSDGINIDQSIHSYPLKGKTIDSLANETVVYRGWMLPEDKYYRMLKPLYNVKAKPITSAYEYISTHYLPRWYGAIFDLTPETITFIKHDGKIHEFINNETRYNETPDSEYILRVLKHFGGKCFVKDYVKSFKTSPGPIISSPEEFQILHNEMIKYQGNITGGFCFRKVEDFIPETEKRYFVIKNKPFSPDPNEIIPDIVNEVVNRIGSNFYSVDIVKRTDDVLRVVEIGDGQVSDLVGWTPERFADIWRENVNNIN